jgi:hypothetical protein
MAVTVPSLLRAAIHSSVKLFLQGTDALGGALARKSTSDTPLQLQSDNLKMAGWVRYSFY